MIRPAIRAEVHQLIEAAIRDEVRRLLEEEVVDTLLIQIPVEAVVVSHDHISALASNLDSLRIECGWSFDALYEATGISKKLSIGHIRHDKGVHPGNLKLYADAFAKALGRPVTVRDLSTLKGGLGTADSDLR